jgi:hypothetical protein
MSVGSGRGILTTANIAPSEALLVSQPIAICRGDLGADLRPHLLLEELQSKGLSEADQYRLSLLYNGQTEGPSRTVVPLDHLTHAEEHLKRQAAKKEAAKKGFGAAAAAAAEGGPSSGVQFAPTAPPSCAHTSCPLFSSLSSSHPPPPLSSTPFVTSSHPPLLLSPSCGIPASSHIPDLTSPEASERLERILKLNAFGHPHSDLTASRSRGEAPSAFVGLWPEVSMLNHRRVPGGVERDGGCAREVCGVL